MTGQDKQDRDVEDTAEDLLGVNFRSVRTLWALIVRPNAVFRAYADGDRNRYSPALRLWIALVGLQTLLHAWWGGSTELMRRQIQAEMQPDAVATIESGFGISFEVFVETYAQIAGFLMAPVAALFTMLSIFVLGWMKTGLRWPVRVNIAFSVLNAGVVLGLVALPLAMWRYELIWVISGVSALVYFTTVFRGAPGVLSQGLGDRIVKSALFTLSLMVLLVIGGFVTSLIASVVAPIWFMLNG